MKGKIKKVVFHSDDHDWKSDNLNEAKFDLIFENINNNNILGCIKKVVLKSIEQNLKYIIISTSNHKYSTFYQEKLFDLNIKRASEYNCDILCGGLSHFYNAVVVKPSDLSLIWIDKFVNSNYFVVFHTIFNDILKLENIKVLEDLGDLTVNKMIVFPFISTNRNMSLISSDKKTAFDPFLLREKMAIHHLELCMNAFKRFKFR